LSSLFDKGEPGVWTFAPRPLQGGFLEPFLTLVSGPENGQPQIPFGAVITEACIPVPLPDACDQEGYATCWCSAAQCDIQPMMKLPIAKCSTKKVHAIAQRLLKIPNTTTESAIITIATANFIASPSPGVFYDYYLYKTHET
jgi:hypothetical protein